MLFNELHLRLYLLKMEILLDKRPKYKAQIAIEKRARKLPAISRNAAKHFAKVMMIGCLFFRATNKKRLNF